MGSYIASDRSVAAARASGAQHRSMNLTQSLEKSPTSFSQKQNEPSGSTPLSALTSGPQRQDSTEPKAKTENSPGKLKHSAPRPTPKPSSPRRAAPPETPKGYAVYALCAKNVYNMQWTMTSASESGAGCQNVNAADCASRRAKPGRYHLHADRTTVLPPNLPARGDCYSPLLLRRLHGTYRCTL